MTVDSLLDDIQELNLAYLLLAQKLLREDPVTALFRLKLSPETAELIAGLSVKQLMQLSRTKQMLCRMVLDDAGQLARITQGQRESGLGQIHAALLMASAAPAGAVAG
ncbi:flagellar transcriptional regulator FlhD [Pseudomonas stutzeri]|nr:flagellar transcriptional regulator FlhD [Stutzerimonas stutzeri]